jgi:hypothetical protein
MCAGFVQAAAEYLDGVGGYPLNDDSGSALVGTRTFLTCDSCAPTPHRFDTRRRLPGLGAPVVWSAVPPLDLPRVTFPVTFGKSQTNYRPLSEPRPDQQEGRRQTRRALRNTRPCVQPGRCARLLTWTANDFPLSTGKPLLMRGTRP